MTENTPLMGKCLYDFTGQGANQLNLTVGQTIKILVKGPPGGWSKGEEPSGKIGFFPSDYVEIILSTSESIQSPQTPPPKKPVAETSNVDPSPTQNQAIVQRIMSSDAPHTKLDFSGIDFVLPSIVGKQEPCPLWHQLLFLDLFADRFVDKTNHGKPNPSASAWLHVQHALQTVYSLISDLRGLDIDNESLKYGHKLVINTLYQTCSGENVMPGSSSDANRLFLFLASFIAKLKNLDSGGVIMLPTILTNDDNVDTAVMIIVRRISLRSDHDFTVTVVNTWEGVHNNGGGLHYHAMNYNGTEGFLTRNIAFEFKNIPNHKVLNTSLWFVIIKSTVYPDTAKLKVRVFYERILPYLCASPLSAAMQEQAQNMEFRPVPLAGDRSYVILVMESLRYVLRRAGLSSEDTELFQVIIRWNALRCVKNDIVVKKNELSMGEVDIARIALQCLAQQAGKYGHSCADLPSVSRRLGKILDTITDLDSTLDAIERGIGHRTGTNIALPKFQLAQEAPLKGICSWLWFGRLRRDTSVDELAGTAALPEIMRPVELTLIPDRVSSFNEAGAVLRHALNLCVLLSNQKSLIMNSYTLRICMISHIFIRVIPIPLPLQHPERKHRCFWHSQPMRAETQQDLLRLINMLCRHFSAASLSVNVTRSGDAIRILTLSAMAAVCDAILRKVATDVPSQASLHYSGMAPGPIRPFGFDVGNFRVESEYLQFNSPETSVARTQVLDYFQEIKECIPEDHLMFRFERGNVLGKAERRFVDQVCVQVGFPRGFEVEYLTGEDPILLDHYPEVGYFRDLVFMFKLMMVPTSDALPELRSWGPTDASLKWTSHEETFVVHGFEKKLECTATIIDDDDDSDTPQTNSASGTWLSAIWKFFGGSNGRPRAPPSKANPSVLVGERIDTEDDVLHIRDLPDFDGTLSARDCELMLQYLTAPYLRIPLLLNFFSDEIRMKSLRNKDLQEVLDAALFEPGRWQKESRLSPPETVPAPSRKHISTPVGLLFNELMMAPGAIMKSVQKLLEQVIDLDVGSYSQTSDTILYVLRLAVRVEGYIIYLLRNISFHKKQREASERIPHGAYYEALVRGLETDDDVYREAQECRQAIRSVLTTKMIKILVRWIKKAKEDGKIFLACMLHAHVAYIYRNIQPTELDARIALILLGGQIYLNNNYRYDMDIHEESTVSKKALSRQQEDVIQNDLGIPVVELYDMNQRNRKLIFDWLTSNPQERSKVMDAIVHLVKEAERPVTDTEADNKLETVSRSWVSIKRTGFAGKFIPENEVPDFDKRLTAKGRKNFEAFMRETTTMIIDTEINIQLGEFTVKRNAICPLHPAFTKPPDFHTVFEGVPHRDVIQSADVEHRTHRHWIRMVGLGFDLQLWTPDTRVPAFTASTPYESSHTLWLAEILDPWRQLLLKDVRLFVSSSDLSRAGMTILYGYSSSGKASDENGHETAAQEATGDEKAGNESGKHKRTLKEVVVYRYPRVIHIYNVVEYGRRFYRTLIFSSSSLLTLHDFPSESLALQNVMRQCSGNPSLQTEQAESLVILRDVTNELSSGDGPKVQTFIPSRLLTGLMPESLLNQYQFWQNEDDSMTGYMRRDKNNRNVARSVLNVRLLKDTHSNDLTGNGNSVANASISRTYIVDQDEATAMNILNSTYEVHPDTSKPTMYLVNLLAVLAAFGSRVEQNVGFRGGDVSDFEGDASTQHALVRLLLRMDALSHILAWSKAEPTTATGTSIDLIELPRLRLTFERIVQPDGGSRYLCLEQSGLFLALSSVTADAGHLLQGLPHAVILSNMEQELFLLLPATSKPILTKNKMDKFAYNLSIVPGDKTWLENTGESTYFVYSIHISGTFLLPKSVGSILYLLLFRLIHRNYREAFKLAKSCVCDRVLLPQEKQFFETIGTLKDTLNPDIYACRLILYYASYGCSDLMPYPWNLAQDMQQYCVKRSFISVYCRLSAEEEVFIMSHITPGSEGIDYEMIANRETLLRATFETLGGSRKVPIVLYPPLVDAKSILEDAPDLESLDSSSTKFKPALAKVSISKYVRPEECSGPQAIAFLIKVIDEGVDLRGRINSLGFMFLYDLLSNNLGVKILPDEKAHGTGAALFRLLTDDTIPQQPQPFAILRIMVEHPDLASKLPSFEDKRKLKLPSFTGADVFQTHVKNVCSMLVPQLTSLKADLLGLGVKSTLQYRAPATMEITPYNPKNMNSRYWYSPTVTDFNRPKIPLSNRIPAGMVKLEKLISPQDVTAFATIPLAIIGLGNFVEMKTLTARGSPPVKADTSFDVLHHPSSRSHIARTSLSRLQQDIRDFAVDENAVSTPVLKLIAEIEAQLDKPSLESATKKMMELGNGLRRLKDRDVSMLKTAMDELKEMINMKPSEEKTQSPSPVLAHNLLQRADFEPNLDLEFLALTVAASETGPGDIITHNPLLKTEEAAALSNVVLIIMLTANRISQTNLALVQARNVFKMLNSLRNVLETAPNAAQLDRLKKELFSSGAMLANTLTARREYAGQTSSPGVYELDPRLLLFEYCHSLILRKSQVQLVRKLVNDIKSGQSACHQMIMGAGKTTVVGPLLAMLLADAETLVMEVVPNSLLEFSAGVLREKCSAIINRPIFTFTFDRYQSVTPQLVSKLVTARQLRAVVVSTPTCIKSFMLKFIEICHLLSRQKDTLQENKETDAVTKLTIAQRLGLRPKPLRAVFLQEEELRNLRRQGELCIQIFEIFKNSVEIMDEVDLLLHPLRSELNWPLGEKFPLDFTKSSKPNEGYHGMRWILPGYLLDALFFCSGMPITTDIADSREARVILDELSSTLELGFQTLQLQRTPHLILLSPNFYDSRLLNIMSRWLLLWLRGRRLPLLTDEEVLEYLGKGVNSSSQLKLKVSQVLADEFVKMLNLGHVWVTSFLPFVLQKINRVHYGLLHPSDIAFLEKEGVKIPSTRKLLAVPFVAKDVPSRASEFSHPDVIIGLTILAFRFEGLRKSDFRIVMRHLLESLEEELGSYDQRISYQLFEQWVLNAGRVIRGSKRKRAKIQKLESSTKSSKSDLLTLSVSSSESAKDLISFEKSSINVFVDKYEEDEAIWPLHMIDVGDKGQMKVLYPLLCKLPHTVMYFLDEIIFPEMLAHQDLKLSTCGQELGGEILFSRRIGFSGTPSDILPVELGSCQYERGSDGKVVHFLSSPEVVQYHVMPPEWTVKSLLDYVAKSEPPLSALIDTGALITGMSNLDVAEYLLSTGLANMKGVVFLDEQDRLMVLLRKGRIVVKLLECGLAWNERFSFYDHIHTTGMDIKQAVDAVAALTLGKDMVFRDYAQGAFRMRGIGAGQTIRLIVVPEILQRIKTQVAAGAGSTVAQREREVAAKGNSHEPFLRDVISWLVINSMRVDGVQFSLLCEQSVSNIWRKRAFRHLITNVRELEQEKCPKIVVSSLLVFRERVDHRIENTVPVTERYSERIATMISSNGFMMETSDEKTANMILSLIIEEEARTNEIKAREKQTKLLVMHEEADHVLDPSTVATEQAFNREQVQEQEQEQEQEKEQEKEKEKEELRVEEIVEEDFVKLKYNREEEDLVPWKLDDLSGQPTDGRLGFYPLSKFAVFKNAARPQQFLKFPEFMWVSRNYFNPQWAVKKQHRRLKNVIVMVDWVPTKMTAGDAHSIMASIGKLTHSIGSHPTPSTSGPASIFTPQQEELLVRCFELFDADEDGYLTRDDIMQVAEVMALKDAESLSKLMSYLKSDPVTNGSGTNGHDLLSVVSDSNAKVSFSGFREMIREQVESLRFISYHSESGASQKAADVVKNERFCAVLCLAEGEHLRRALHLMKQSLKGGPSTAISPVVGGLWTLGSGEGVSTSVIFEKDWNRMLLGSSQGFRLPRYSQYSAMRNSLRFLNNDIDIKDEDVSMLLRVLSSSTCEERLSWWMDVRACRRRRQLVWDGSAVSIGAVFCTVDEYHFMEYKALILRVKAALKDSGMLVFDAFRAMNSSRSGVLSCSELYGGMEWLGIRLTPPQVYDLVRRLSVEFEGMVSYRDFKRAFQSSEEEMESHGVGNDSKTNFVVIPPKPIPELSEASQPTNSVANVEVTPEMLRYIKVKVKPIAALNLVWSSQGTLSQTQLSIWTPDLQVSVMRSSNRARVCLGFYAARGLSNPLIGRGAKTLNTIEITDTASLRLIQRSRALASVLDKVLPYPARFKNVWHMSRGNGPPLYAWRAIPPDSAYVALGMVCTNSENPPDVTCMRCVPLVWCAPARTVPVKIWDDSGAGGGRPGSVWVINSIDMIAFVPGHEQPKDAYYDLNTARFFLDESMLASLSSNSTNNGNNGSASTSAGPTPNSSKK